MHAELQNDFKVVIASQDMNNAASVLCSTAAASYHRTFSDLYNADDD